ncbi:hypothetical protein JKP88DRAFT_241291 [Tribonema minus]|uniref:Uncharacterized protein n=1 Tax=Tribonema minus TaxID=303371 RepID=A0A835YZU1_9STRA|nr:hypothetical protein JKP88DRAFT_241291 [Tribonema minus]
MEFERLKALALLQSVRVVEDGFVEVLQGAPVLSYIEMYGPPEITQSNFAAGKGDFKTELIDIFAVHGMASAVRKTMKHRVDDAYFLTQVGREALARLREHELHAVIPAPKDLQCFSMMSHCNGGARRGVDGASGSNCQRDPFGDRFCASTSGTCEPGCAWAALTTKKKADCRHLCSFRIALSATLSQVERGVIQLRIIGQHTRAESWIPPAADKLSMSLTLRDNLIRSARAGPAQRSTIVSQAANNLPAGMAQTSRNVPLRKQVTNVVAYDRRLSRGNVAGSFTAVDVAIRTHHLCLASPLPATANRDGVLVLFYQSGADKTMQLVVSTPQALEDAHLHGRAVALSDAKHDTSDTHAPFATMLCPAPGGGTLPLAVSLSSTENSSTTAQLALSLRHAVRCSDPECPHSFVEQFGLDGAYRRWRPCATRQLFAPTVSIDKSATSRDAFASVGFQTVVCVFHNLVAIIQHLQTVKRAPRAMLAVFEQAIHLLFRAQTSALYQRVLAVFVLIVREWGDAGKLGSASVDDIVTYLEDALGLAGTGWEGTMGDHIARAVHGLPSTNNAAEVHFRLIDRCILQDTTSTSLLDWVEILLGTTAHGTASPRMSYFGFFSVQRREREAKGGARLAGDILRRSLEGRWLNLNGNVIHAGKYCYVKAGVQRITRDAASQTQRVAARVRETTGSDLSRLHELLKPLDLPALRSGYYIVDPVAETCFLCSDYIWRGNARDACAHVHAAKAFIGEYGNIAEQQRRLHTYAHQIEKKKSATVPRNAVLYDTTSTWEAVRSQLLLGPEPTAAATAAQPVEYSVTLREGVECNITLQPVQAIVRTSLELEGNVYSIARGSITGVAWSPALKHGRDVLPHDIVLSVGDVAIDSAQSAAHAQVQLMDSSRTRVMTIRPFVATKKCDAPSVIAHLADVRQPGMGRAYRRVKHAKIDATDVMRPQDAQTTREKGRVSAAGKRREAKKTRKAAV